MAALQTTDAVIDELGGDAAVAAICGYTSKRVWNWRTAYRGRFPAETFLVLQDALRAIGKTAPPSLWGIAEPARKRRAAA